MHEMSFKDYLATVEGILLPDKPAVPGTSRLNMSLYPRSRYKVNPTLRPPKVKVPVSKQPPTPTTQSQTPAAATPNWTATLTFSPTPSSFGSTLQPAG